MTPLSTWEANNSYVDDKKFYVEFNEAILTCIRIISFSGVFSKRNKNHTRHTTTINNIKLRRSLSLQF